MEHNKPKPADNKPADESKGLKTPAEQQKPPAPTAAGEQLKPPEPMAVETSAGELYHSIVTGPPVYTEGHPANCMCVECCRKSQELANVLVRDRDH